MPTTRATTTGRALPRGRGEWYAVPARPAQSFTVDFERYLRQGLASQAMAEKAESVSKEPDRAAIMRDIEKRQRRIRDWEVSIRVMDQRHGPDSMFARDNRTTGMRYINIHKDAIRRLESLLKSAEPDICDIIMQESE